MQSLGGSRQGDKTPGIIYEPLTPTLGLYLLNEWPGPAISLGIYLSPGAEDTKMWRCKNDKFSDSAKVVFHCHSLWWGREGEKKGWVVKSRHAEQASWRVA